MSELQISLLAIGALVVIAVVIYNKWQERKLARSTDETFRSRHDDVLLKSSVRDADWATEQTVARQRIEPVLRAGEDGAAEAVPPAADEAIDYIVHIETGQPVSGDIVASTVELLAMSRARLEGYSESRRSWEPLDSGTSYARLRAALQLASRQGVVQQHDLEDFSAAVDEAAQRIGASVQAPDQDPALARARELDAFCGDVDLQIALHVMSRDGRPFAGARLRSLAEAAGMMLAADGQFHLQDDAGRVLYSLTGPQPFHAETMHELATPGVTLLLDVPRAPGGVATFHGCAALAQHLAESLDAVVADDNHNPLDARAFNAIAAQLATVYQAMEARGIAAGSPLALRLFS